MVRKLNNNNSICSRNAWKTVNWNIFKKNHETNNMFLYKMDFFLSHKWLKLIISHKQFEIFQFEILKSDIKISVSCVSNRNISINLGLTTVSNVAKFRKTVTLVRFACIKIVSNYLSIYPSFFKKILKKNFNLNS